MSEILSKSIHMSGTGAAPSAATKTQINSDDLLFAALFGGATGDTSADDETVEAVALASVFAVQTSGQNDPENPPQEALSAMVAALQVANGFDQKHADKAKDASSENNNVASVDENSDVLTDMIAAGPLGLHIDPVNANAAKGAIAGQLQNTKLTRANMAFEDGKSSGQATGNLPKVGAGPMQDLIQGSVAQTTPINSAAKPSGKLAAIGQAAPSETFIGPMPALSADAKMAANIANLRAIRAANLEQRNAEINTKLSGGDDVDFTVKSDKPNTTMASLKKGLVSDSTMVMSDKVLARATNGLDMARPSQALSVVVDSASGTNVQSLNNQAGGQNGGQTGGQSSAAAGGGLLNNLNMLQTLDMAKNNWTEMLLQRVQKGLAGGKDKLDFQLNPRNLGKMQISLVIQNDRTNIQIQTETSVAASMLSDSEARLTQMLEASGLRLGNFNSGQSQGFGGNLTGGHANQQNQAENSDRAIAGEANDDDSNNVDANTGRSENLINIQA